MDWKAFLGFVMLSTMVFTVTFQKESECKREMDLMVVIDGTITFGYDNFDNMKSFVSAVLSKLPIGRSGVRVGIIQFSDQWSTAVEMNLGEHGGVDSVLSFLKRMDYMQGYFTLTGMALEMANDQFFGRRSKTRPRAEKVLLLITDGMPADLDKARHEAKVLKEKGVRIVTVAIASTDKRIQKFKYVVRSMASGFKQSFKSRHVHLQQLVKNVRRAICAKALFPRTSTLRQKCFQEKKDIVFAVDGSSQVEENTFKKAVRFISGISEILDITSTLIHVGFIQYSDFLNTRIEFGLNQYTDSLKVNDSLNNILYSKGKEADLVNALRIVDKEMFTGSKGDRLSATDFLLLFINDKVKDKHGVLDEIQKLRGKGVHVIVIGLGRSDIDVANYYEELASHPSDVSYLHSVELKHVVGDLASTSCRVVNCQDDPANGDKPDCKQSEQDILIMIDSSQHMDRHFSRVKKFLAKIVKKLNIAATNIHVGLLQFGDRYDTKITFKLGQYRFENDIRAAIKRARQSWRRSWATDIGYALKMVNKQIFNESTGGGRVGASDLIFMATTGSTVNRAHVKREIKLLKDKGVRIVVLDVDFKNPSRKYQNTIHDIASGPREIFQFDFKQMNTISQSILDVKCAVKEEKVSPLCFERVRKVLFMLDSSTGLEWREIRNVLKFIEKITTKLHKVPSKIALGLLQYSDMFTTRLELKVKRRPLGHTLRGIRNIRYRKGTKNYLGNSLKYVNRKIFTDDFANTEDEKIVIVLTHNVPDDPEETFKFAEKLKEKGVEMITIVIHTEKKPTDINEQYKALSSSPGSAHSFDYDSMLQKTNDIILNICELNACPKGSTKDCTPKKQDIFMVIDSSRSIGHKLYPQLRRFVHRLVSKLDVSHDRTNIGILQASDYYSTEYEMMLSEYTDPNEVKSIINEMTYHSGMASFIGSGIEKAVKDNLFNGSGSDRPDAENVLMIFTDGVLHDEHVARRQIELLKEDGVRVVIVGLGEQSRKPRAKQLLESVASSRTDAYLVHLDKDALLVESELNEVVRHVTILDCVNKYIAPIRCSPQQVDLFVIIDGSRSVGWKNFGKVQDFLQKLAEEFDIGDKKAHFGVLQFGDKKETRIEFNLNTYANNNEVDEAIKNITFLSSVMTHTGHAISIVNKKIFTGKGGDRPDVPNILIVFTDGSAHDIHLAYTQANELKQRGTRIIGIAAGNDVERFYYQLKRLVSRTEDAHRSKFDQLSGIVDDLLDVVCTPGLQ